MQRLFYSLVNGSFGDPGLYLELAGDGFLIDCGDLRPLSAPRVHRVREVLISHAHVDHVFGLDWLLRLMLGEDRSVRIFGPARTADRVLAKLEGYTWNITLDFTLRVEVTEVEGERARTSRLALRNGIERHMRVEEAAVEDGVVLETPGYRLRCAPVEHGTPCLAYAFEQKKGARVRDEDLARLGLAPGAWIRDFKAAILAGPAPGAEIDVGAGRRFAVERLAAEIAEVVPGTKVAYVTDTTLDEAVRGRIVNLARGADVFFCEAKFIERDRAKAQAAKHLTALDAATLARDAGVRELVLFHPSPRYEGNFGLVLDEARRVFPHARFQNEAADRLTGA